MSKWEYYVYSLAFDDWNRHLHMLGEAGWELCIAFKHPMYGDTLIFKRLKGASDGAHATTIAEVAKRESSGGESF